MFSLIWDYFLISNVEWHILCCKHHQLVPWHKFGFGKHSDNSVQYNNSQPFFSTWTVITPSSLFPGTSSQGLSTNALWDILAGPSKDMQGLIPEPLLHCGAPVGLIYVLCFNADMMFTSWSQYSQLLGLLPDQMWVDCKLYRVLLGFYFLHFTMMEPSALWGILPA